MRSFEIAKRNIRRTPYQALAASMVMFFTFLILIVFLLIALGSEQILKYYESKPIAIAFFKDNTTQADVNAIKNALQQTGKITTLKYVSQEEALEIYREKNENKPALQELVTASYLPTSLEVSAISPQDLGPISEILKKEPVVEEVIFPEDVVQNLTKATNVVRWVGGGAVLFSSFFSFLVILMIIGFKIRLKRNEIAIMKLLGASMWFIRAPFIVEGITYGVIGALGAWVVSYLALWYVTPFLEGSIRDVNLLPVSPLTMLSLLGVALSVAFLIGALGSFGAVRRYLKI